MMVFSGTRVQNGNGGRWEDRSIHTCLNPALFQGARLQVSDQ